MKSSDISPTLDTLNSKRRAMRVALGKEPADLLLRNGRVLNVFTGRWELKDVAIKDGLVAALGNNIAARKSFDAQEALLVPGFIDAHIHLESTHLWLPEISRLMLTHGVTTVITDPHEMANVAGIEGVREMLKASRHVNLDIFFKVPSCVPASEFEESGARLDVNEIKELLAKPEVIGLAEVMNFPGVLTENVRIWEKLGLSTNIDGHFPGGKGQHLQAYVAAGIDNDHETSDVTEALEKIKTGMWLFIREGSAARNLDTLLDAVDNYTFRRACFCTDDLSPQELLEHGSMDYIVRQAVTGGLALEQALIMASWNAAQAHGLHRLGAIAPGYFADIALLTPESLTVKNVFKKGKLISPTSEHSQPVPDFFKNSVKLPQLDISDFQIPYKKQLRAIGIMDGEILTTEEYANPVCRNGFAESKPQEDLLKAAVIERHGKSGNIGLGFVKGLGIKNGAMASTLAHDAHNLIVVGTTDSDMLFATLKLAEIGGGQILVSDGKIISSLPLPIVGLMSEANAEEVAKKARTLKLKTQEIGSKLKDPYATLSFLALSVIPKLRLTTHGLLDVDLWKIIN